MQPLRSNARRGVPTDSLREIFPGRRSEIAACLYRRLAWEGAWTTRNWGYRQEKISRVLLRTVASSWNIADTFAAAQRDEISALSSHPISRAPRVRWPFAPECGTWLKPVGKQPFSERTYGYRQSSLVNSNAFNPRTCRSPAIRMGITTLRFCVRV